MLAIFKKSYWVSEVYTQKTTVSYNTQLLRVHNALEILQQYYMARPVFKKVSADMAANSFKILRQRYEDDITLERLADQQGEKLEISAQYEYQPNLYKADPHEYLQLLSAVVFQLGIFCDTNMVEKLEGIKIRDFHPALVTILPPLEEGEIDPTLTEEEAGLVKQYFIEDIQNKLVSKHEAEKSGIRTYWYDPDELKLAM